MEKTITDKAIRRLWMHYNTHVMLLVAFFLFVLFQVIDLSEYIDGVTLVAEQYALLITIIAIPLSLKLFSDKRKKIPEGLDELSAAKAYSSIYFLRLYTISAVTLGNIVLFSVSRNSNFMWLTIVLFVVYFFCKPSYVELISLTGRDENTEHEENA